MCGNGIRCFARYIKDRGILTTHQFKVETLAGCIVPEILASDADGRQVRVDMGVPILRPHDIPFVDSALTADQVQNHVIEALGTQIPVTAVSMGNPHCMIFQDDLEQRLDPAVYGPAVETHPVFPEKTNVEFMEILDCNTAKVTVWERGCGFTLACGTGACASAVAAVLNGKTEPVVDIILPGGTLKIEWEQASSGHVFMTGPADYVFEGVVTIPETL